MVVVAAEILSELTFAVKLLLVSLFVPLSVCVFGIYSLLVSCLVSHRNDGMHE